MSSPDLMQQFLARDTLAAARMLSLVERGGADADAALDALHPRTGRAHRIAVTGAGGAGKSSLVNALTRRFRSAGSTVGIIAEDPTSPFSGGAVLGDRVRMTHAAGDPGVFVRSLASRGSESGLSTLACELGDVLDAFGQDIVVLESMGASQVETRVRFAADTVVVVMTPESGDEVQSIKAGLLEVADVLVVNKSDRPGADALLGDLTALVSMRAERDGWNVPVVATVASREEGIDALDAALAAHRTHLDAAGRRKLRRREALRQRLRALTEARALAGLWQSPTLVAGLDAIFERVAAGAVSPGRAARELAARIRVDSPTSFTE